MDPILSLKMSLNLAAVFRGNLLGGRNQASPKAYTIRHVLVKQGTSGPSLSDAYQFQQRNNLLTSSAILK